MEESRWVCVGQRAEGKRLSSRKLPEAPSACGGPRLTPEIIPPVNPREALELCPARSKWYMFTITITGVIIITGLVARWIWLAMPFQSGLPSYTTGVDCGPVVQQPMKEEFDNFGTDSASHLRPSLFSLLYLNSQD